MNAVNRPRQEKPRVYRRRIHPLNAYEYDYAGSNKRCHRKENTNQMKMKRISFKICDSDDSDNTPLRSDDSGDAYDNIEINNVNIVL